MINLKLLNDKQKEAVLTMSDKVFVVAGAGCGKTRVLTYRIAFLIACKVPEENILAFTFTNKAANEMKYRLRTLLNRETKVKLSTFHSYCLSILKSFPEYIDYKPYFVIIDEDDKKKIIRDILIKQNNPINDLKTFKAISQLKSMQRINTSSLKETILILKVFYAYQKILKNSNRMDFDDLLYQFNILITNQIDILEALQAESYFILIDECQDINRIQYEIILKLSRIHNQIFMVGDEDQCIYSFRGSDISCINDFIRKENAEVIKLEQNYRSCKNILIAANYRTSIYMMD